MDEVAGYFRNKSACITGGAGGIGLALGRELLSRGAALVVLLDRDGKRLTEQCASLFETYAGRVAELPCDVTREAEVRTAVGSIIDKYGRIDILINNAGGGFSGGFEEQTNDDWDQAFALNFYGPIYAVRAVLPTMRRQGAGHIVNIISGIAFAPMAQQTMYAASKAALNALSLALRYELWDEGIKVTSATPGTTATAIWGDTGPPEHAQTAEQAAATILDGVARNDRLVLGDDADASGAANAFNPSAAQGMDNYLLEVARRRKRGEVAI